MKISAQKEKRGKKEKRKTHTQLFKERQTQYEKSQKQRARTKAHTYKYRLFHMRNMLDENFFISIYSLYTGLKRYRLQMQRIDGCTYIFVFNINEALNKYKMP